MMLDENTIKIGTMVIFKKMDELVKELRFREERDGHWRSLDIYGRAMYPLINEQMIWHFDGKHICKVKRLTEKSGYDFVYDTGINEDRYDLSERWSANYNWVKDFEIDGMWYENVSVFDFGVEGLFEL